jgi:hypothetical protein
MGVKVDDPRHQREAAAVNHLDGVFADISDRGDAAIRDGNVGPQRVMAEPVDNRRAADNQIMHRRLLCAFEGMSSIKDYVFYRRQMILIAPRRRRA